MVTTPTQEAAAVGRSVRHGSITTDRLLAAAPHRIFAAFAELPQRDQWFRIPGPPESARHELDFRVGGAEIAENVFAPSGVEEHVAYRARFLDIVADERILFSSELVLDGLRRSVSLVTVVLAPEAGGTRLTYTEQYTLLAFEADGSRDAAHQEGSIPLLLNRLKVAVVGRSPRFTPPRNR